MPSLYVSAHALDCFRSVSKRLQLLFLKIQRLKLIARYISTLAVWATWPYKKKVFQNVSKIHDNANVTIVRPGIIKAPLLDYLSLGISYQKALKQQIE